MTDTDIEEEVQTKIEEELAEFKAQQEALERVKDDIETLASVSNADDVDVGWGPYGGGYQINLKYRTDS